MTANYCPDCHKIIPDAEIKWGYHLPEQRYGDNAHPAEYDEPACPECGAELTDGEACKLCEDTFEPEQIKNGLCVNCRAFKLIENIVSLYDQFVKSTLIEEYAVSDDEAHNIYKEQLREYAK